MIDPKLLTSENGFVEGCAVEIEHSIHGRIVSIFDSDSINPDGIHTGVYNEGWIFAAWDEIISIRPLTDPMAIWNFAPGWALSLIRTPDQDVIWSRRTAADQVQEHTAQDRPWWAKNA